jgi:hypothetical protein
MGKRHLASYALKVNLSAILEMQIRTGKHRIPHSVHLTTRGIIINNMKEYIKFNEYNDNEGEDWNFYLQAEGNEKEIEKLKNLINEADESETYIVTNFIKENEVDVLVKHSDSGYMMFENKVTGKMNIPENFEVDNLYKGGITKLFV